MRDSDRRQSPRPAPGNHATTVDGLARAPKADEGRTTYDDRRAPGAPRSTIDEPRTANDDPRPTPTGIDSRSTRTRTRTQNASGPAKRAHAGFSHENLDAYRVALELTGRAKQSADRIPRGHRSLADHLQRAAANTVLLLAEGANRRGAPLERQRFVESRGECAEVAAAADLLIVLGIGASEDAEELKRLAGRVSAMLTRLIAALG